MSALGSGLSYYTGPVSVTSLEMQVTFASVQSADVEARYIFWNNATETLSLPVQFLGFPSSVTYEGLSAQGSSVTLSLPPGETTLLARFTQPFDSLTSFTLSPGYYLEGKTPVQKIERIDYKVYTNAQPIVLMESTPFLTARGESHFETTISNAYPLSLYLTLQQRALQATVSRTVSSFSQIGDEITFTTTIQNTGEQPLSGLTIQDSLFSLYFEPVSAGFVFTSSGGVGESLYLYTSPSFSLAPGETKTLTYTAKVTQLGSSAFPGARLFSGNNYITSSTETTATLIPRYVTADTVDVSPHETAYSDPVVTPLVSQNDTLAPYKEQIPVLDEQEKEIFAEQQPGSRESSTVGWFILLASLLILLAVGGIYYILQARRTTSPGVTAS